MHKMQASLSSGKRLEGREKKQMKPREHVIKMKVGNASQEEKQGAHSCCCMDCRPGTAC